MKIAKKIMLLYGVLIMAFSCNYLDYDEDVNWTAEEIWSSYTYITRSLATLYYYLPDGFYETGSAFLDSATDNSESLDQDYTINRFNLGNWNEFNNPDCTWDDNYAGIYQSNIFIENADTTTLYYYQYDVASREVYLRNLNYYRGEARFVKAYLYFDLMKRYGDVPIVEEWIDEVTPLYYERKSVEEVVDLIGELCDDALNYLPAKGDLSSTDYTTNLGHAFKGTAHALKNRAFLYVASELHNPDGSNDIYYEKSIQSAIDLFELDEYALASTYASLFAAGTTTMMNNDEVILDIRNSATRAIDAENYPIGFYDGRGQTNPTQDLVDAYEFTSGEIFDWDNPDHVANIYTDRDSRFYTTILYNGAVMGPSGETRAVETFEGGLDASNTYLDGTRTGYYLAKYIHLDADMFESETAKRFWPLFRYAEVLLNYAEALNEISGPEVDTYGAGKTALSALNEVRVRAKQPALSSGITQEELREAIRRERRVEFAYEAHRHWDVRRWKIAESTIGVPIHGVKVTQDAVDPTQFSYEKFEVEDRAFEEKMYLYPLPSSETLIANPLPQTVGW